MNHLIRALTILMAVGFSSGSTAGVLERAVKFSEKVEKKRNPLDACFTAFEKGDGSLTGTFYTGATYKVEIDETGRPNTYKYTSPGGQEVAVVANPNMTQSRDAAVSTEQNAEIVKMRAKMSAMMKEAIGINCKLMLASNRKIANVNSKDSPSVAASKSANGEEEYSTDDFYSWFLPEWTYAFTEDDFYAEADYTAEEWFDGEVENRRVSTAPTVQCEAVVNDCKGTCDRVGALGGGVMCSGLGAVAAVVLSPPIGIAVGAYCGGKVFVKVEECRSGCNMPAVPCRY